MKSMADRQTDRNRQTNRADRQSSSLPVLFMFLKLPKLFSFHILRFATGYEISRSDVPGKQRGERENEGPQEKRRRREKG